MSDKDIKKDQENEDLQENTTYAETDGQEQDTDQAGADQQDGSAAELAEMKDKYVRLMAEFENFRRRTARERIELSKTATQDVMESLLPVLDDMERARQSIETTSNVDAVIQGLELVFQKLKNVTQQKGLKPIEINAGDDFDSDFQEAITQAPAPSDELKGKVIDVVEKGYTLNDKVIRFAKVVIGA
ncbi:nucleotide exchange factor GrpE [Pontibacter sp. 172403-2]|uniref:nucleotide exchange factor GrpE n=1 Tax=Pontibacter rufus TaxID=2791028 RepID=UPI0018AF5CE9|nr:nucleotide exchange factor GrpE [Pontibacter sp. 172403-2]MBF9252063.1 nucleotide exchange factor GrpE [Pontibacter sp. 172403-2]